MPHPRSRRRELRAMSPTASRPAWPRPRPRPVAADILLHGAATAQECLRAGLLDEMELQLMPVLLGQGRRLFEDLPPDHIELELLRSLDGPGVLHLRYRVWSAG